MRCSQLVGLRSVKTTCKLLSYVYMLRVLDREMLLLLYLAVLILVKTAFTGIIIY